MGLNEHDGKAVPSVDTPVQGSRLSFDPGCEN